MQNNSHRQELKERILDASLKMFKRQGIRQVRMDDIAHALSISKRTLYEIYDNKEQLLMDAVKYQDVCYVKIMTELIESKSNTIEVLVSGYQQQMKELSDINPLFFEDIGLYKSVKDFLRSKHNERKVESRKFIEEGIREGYFLKNLDYGVITNLLDATSEYIMNANMYKKYGMTTIFHNFVVVFLRGICTLKGVKLLDNLMRNVDENNEG